MRINYKNKGEIFSLFILGIIVFLASTILVLSLTLRNRLSIKSKAQQDACVTGIIEGSVKFLRSDGTEVRNGEVIDDVNGIQCQVRVSGVERADKFLVCSIRKDNFWPVSCPRNSGDFKQEFNNGFNDVTTTFFKCDQGLLNPPIGHPQLSAGMRLEVVAARFTTGSADQCRWDNPSQYVGGPVVYFQRKIDGKPESVSPITSPTSSEDARLFINRLVPNPDIIKTVFAKIIKVTL